MVMLLERRVYWICLDMFLFSMICSYENVIQLECAAGPRLLVLVMLHAPWSPTLQHSNTAPRGGNLGKLGEVCRKFQKLAFLCEYDHG